MQLVAMSCAIHVFQRVLEATVYTEGCLFNREVLQCFFREDIFRKRIHKLK